MTQVDEYNVYIYNVPEYNLKSQKTTLKKFHTNISKDASIA